MLAVLEFEDLRDVDPDRPFLWRHGRDRRRRQARARASPRSSISTPSRPRTAKSLFDLVGRRPTGNMRAGAQEDGDGWRIPLNRCRRTLRPRTWPGPVRAGGRSRIKTFEQKLQLKPGRLTLPRHYIYARAAARRPFRPFDDRAKSEAGWNALRDGRQPQSAHHLSRRADGPADPDHAEHVGRQVSQDLAYDVLGQLGRAKRADDSLTITGGDDPVFVTPWRIGRAGSAALGAVGLAVSDLWRLRTGKPQSVRSTCAPPRPRCAPTPTCCGTARSRCRGIRWPATTRRATAGTCSCTPTIRTIVPARCASPAPRPRRARRWPRPSPNGMGSPSRRRSPPATASAAWCAAATNGTPIRMASPSPGCR